MYYSLLSQLHFFYIFSVASDSISDTAVLPVYLSQLLTLDSSLIDIASD